MTEGLPERLSSIVIAVEQAIAECESSMAANADRLQRILDVVERERSGIHGELEQRQLERLVEEGRRDESPECLPTRERELREIEVELLSSYASVSGLHRRVTDFAHLLATSRKHFGASSELPDLDTAHQLAIRQAMIRAKEEERGRLSREIHDGPAQVLANAIIGLEFIERALNQTEGTDEIPAVNEIRRIKSSMREGLSEIRRFIFDLRPSMLSQRGLIRTVQHYIQTYRSLLPDQLDLSLPETAPSLTPDQELTAFRVIQESLQNIHRHAGSSRCQISIEIIVSGTRVTVKDDGRGFDPRSVTPTARGGSGIVGMHERADVIGARLSVESMPGKGTEVCLEIPAVSQSVRSPVGRSIDRSGTSNRSV